MDDYEDSGNLGLMVLIQGTLITNGNNLNINGFQSQGSGVRHLDLGSSEITIRTSGSYSWYYQGSNHTIDAGTSHINLVGALNFTGVNTGFRGALNHAYHHVTYSNPLSTVGRFSGPVFVEKLTFMGNATIVSSSNTIDTLILSAGKKYAFGGGQTQTIGSYLSANSPLCSGLIEMVSATAGSATLQFSPGSVANINNTLIENIAATGNVPVTANNSFDLGGNTNFIFPPATGQTLYWVGGSGDWNDASHWSLVNDGVYPAVGGCVPTPIDDVVFNNNSGFTTGNNIVTLDGVGHYCHDMTWVGAQATPIIIGTANNPLNVYGSMTLQNDMEYRVVITNFLSNDLGEEITTNGAIVGYSTSINQGIYFNGDGSWSFMDDFTTLSRVHHFKGTLITNSHTISMNRFSSSTTGQRHIDLGSSEVIATSAGWSYSGSNHTIDAGTSHLRFLGGSASFTGNLNHMYHHITFENSSGTNNSLRGPVEVQKLTFLGNGSITSSSNTIDTLVLSAGKNYAFQSGQTQTIRYLLDANAPACAGLIQLGSLSSGSQAKLDFPASAVVDINNALIEDIEATGNVPVTANNSFDLGGNTNFIFPPATGQTLYWVGGSGDWNDASHWSLVNDGVYPAVGGCVPTPIDDVVFNNNSGFTTGNNIVTLDGVGHYCHDMTWVGAQATPIIIGTANNPLNVYGSMTLQNDMEYRVVITNFLSNDLGEEITTNGAIVGYSTSINQGIYFNGDGSWSFMDNFTTLSRVKHFKGTLITNSHTISMNRFSSSTTGQRHIDLGSSEVIATSAGWSYSGSNHTIDAGTSHLRFLGGSASFTGNLNHMYHHITFENSSGTNNSLRGPVEVQKLTFLGNGSITSSSITIDTLVLSAGKNYAFQSGQTQTIRYLLDANAPACAGLIQLGSLSSGSQAKLDFPASAVVDINNALIEDIEATGNVPVTANNSFDLGGNIGFDFPLATGQTLYWVGGSGNWNDASHWSLVNDGVYPAVGGCVPTPIDDVVFNNNSGFSVGNNTVTLDGVGHYCHDMTWVGAQATPIIIGTTVNPLNVYGSMTLQNAMEYRVGGTYFLSNNLGETITTNGTTVGNPGSVNVYFDGDGSWDFTDDFRGRVSITLTKGTLITNSHTLEINSLTSSGSNQRHIDLGSSEVIISDPYYGWRYYGSNHIIDAGTSHLRFLRGHTNTFESFYGASNHIYHHITFENSNENNVLRGPVEVQKLTFSGGGRITSSSNTIDTLILSAGKNYEFQSGQMQTIRQLLDANAPACAGLIQLSSTTSSSQATLHFPIGAVVDINNALIEDIEATGNVPVTANNSFDLGGNIGFDFPLATGQTLYWVGGSGNWNDASHWSLVNDGVYPAVGGCVPTPIDDVVFNNNSGFSVGNNTVTLDGVGHYCHDMTWVGAQATPIIIGTTVNPLNVYGSMTLQNAMEYRVGGTYFLSNNLGETITTNGTTVGNPGSVNVYFDGDGSWDFTDDFRGRVSITLTKGTLITNSHTLEINSLTSSGSNQRHIDLGSSEVIISDPYYGWRYYGSNHTIDAGTSHLRFLRGHTNTFESFYGASNHIYHHITFENSNENNVLRGPVEVQKLTFSGGGRITSSSNTIDTLILSAGKNYEFQSGQMQTIRQLLDANAPACAGLIQLSSTTSSSQATLHFPIGAVVDINNALIEDIEATGNVPVTANNSFDLGGNIGFDFPLATGQTLYWVGGSGNWNDASHWSLVNDGVYPAVGGCVPTPIDDVVFNNNSGFSVGNNTVTLDGVGHYCHDMTWVGAQATPIIIGTTVNPLNVYGSMTLQNAMEYRVGGTYFLSNNLGETITTNGTTVGNPGSVNVYFDGDGSWDFTDDFRGRVSITLTKGTLITNSHTLEINSLTSSGSNQRHIDLGSSEVIISDPYYGWRYYGSNHTIDAGTSHLRFLRGHTNTFESFYGASNHIYHHITFENPNENNVLRGPVEVQKLTFSGGGRITSSSNTIDTLILSAGKNYEFQSGQAQTINHRLYASGNPCYVLFLSSTTSGSPAFLNVLDGSLDFNYTNVRDIDASGSYGTLEMGPQSTDAGNNININFAPHDPNAEIDGFGDHLDLPCPLDPFTIYTDGFYPNPSTLFEWGDGSTADSLHITSFGTYTISVDYGEDGEGCVVRDTLHVRPFDITPPVISNCPTDIVVSNDAG